MPPRRRRHGLELGLILLLNELMQFGMRNIPPITLCSILGQTFLYMGIINVPWSKEEVCISGQAIIKQRDWRRLILAAFEHGDDMHLYYNMASFLIKGRSLEKRYGSRNFAGILMFLTVLTSVVYVLVAKIMSEIMVSETYMKSCAIGFSGVIFALKVLTTHEEPNLKAMLVGVQIPGKYAAWIELILIHLLVANSSFMGHLAGILAGLLYCNTIIGRAVDKFLSLLTDIKLNFSILETGVSAMSLSSKITLYLSCAFSTGVIIYVNYSQWADQKRLHEGVIKDIERQQMRKIENVYLAQQQAELTKELKRRQSETAAL